LTPIGHVPYHGEWPLKEYAMTDSRNGPAAVDPICGMTVDSASAAGALHHKGKTYHFCSAHCLEKFRADPDQFLARAALLFGGGAPAPIDMETRRDDRPAAPAAQEGGAVYVCPMHPEVRQQGPGACPTCGMALEPEAPTAGAAEADPELADMTRRFRVCLVLTVPVFLIGMSHMLSWERLLELANLPVGSVRLLNWLRPKRVKRLAMLVVPWWMSPKNATQLQAL
jgi:Cu+-exporting ATPase